VEVNRGAGQIVVAVVEGQGTARYNEKRSLKDVRPARWIWERHAHPQSPFATARPCRILLEVISLGVRVTRGEFKVHRVKHSRRLVKDRRFVVLPYFIFKDLITTFLFILVLSIYVFFTKKSVRTW
jgi:hypothetical protein